MVLPVAIRKKKSQLLKWDRPGEKLYEELLVAREFVDNQVHDQIFVGKVNTMPLATIEAKMAEFDNLEGDVPKEAIIGFAGSNYLKLTRKP